MTFPRVCCSILLKRKQCVLINIFTNQKSSPSKLWDLLSQPRDVLSEIPSSRFNPHGFYNSVGDTGGHSNVLHSYVLDEDVRAWDADFFNTSANEAAAIDPQQRLLLETVYEALEAGGQRIGDLRGSDTAVFVGLMGEEYSDIQGRELDMMPTVRTRVPFLEAIVPIVRVTIADWSLVPRNRNSTFHCIQPHLVLLRLAWEQHDDRHGVLIVSGRRAPVRTAASVRPFPRRCCGRNESASGPGTLHFREHFSHALAPGPLPHVGCRRGRLRAWRWSSRGGAQEAR